MGRRFERIYEVVEPVEDYKPGGYHPVHIGDTLGQRFTIVRKLAFGRYSTVWLASVDGDPIFPHHSHIDTSAFDKPVFVALKILQARVSSPADAPEIDIWDTITRQAYTAPGKCRVLFPLERFYHDGPNGTHLCTALPVSGGDLQAHARCMPGRKFPLAISTSISKQVIEGLSFLHACHIVHGDIQPGNIVLTVSDSDITDALQEARNECCPVKLLDNVEPNGSAPDYLVIPEPIYNSRVLKGDVRYDCKVKIVDFGGSSHESCDVKPVVPRPFRAPELLGKGPFTADVKNDIWSLGCLMFEMHSGEPLFCLDAFGSTEQFIESEQQRLVQAIVRPELTLEDGVKTFTRYVEQRINGRLSTEEWDLMRLIRSGLLVVNPSCRLRAEDLLKDRLFRKVEQYIAI